MSQEEELFKKQLGDLLSTREFAFQEPAWSDMSALLDAKKKRRRAFFMLWFGLGALLVGLSAWFVKADDRSTNQDVVVKEEKTKRTVSPSLNNATSVMASPGSSELPAVKSSARPAVHSTRPSADHAPDTKAAAMNSVPPTQVKIPNTKIANINSADEHTKPSVAVKNGASAPEKINASMVAATSDNKTDPSPNTKATTEASGLATSTMSDVAANKQTPRAEEERDQSNNKQNKIEEPIIPATISEKSVAATLDQTLKKDSSIITQNLKPDTDYVKTNRPDIRIELGGNLLSGWADTKGRDAAGFNPLAGIVYNVNISKDLKLGLGVQYTRISHLKYSEYTATVTRLDLGRTTKARVFTPQRIHYLLLPIKLHYKLDDRQSAGIGLNVAYLLTVDGKEQEYTETVAGQTAYRSYKTKGYTQGFNNFNSQITLFYQRKFAPHFWLNGEVMYGLSDIKNGEVLKSSGVERNSGIKLSVLYTLFEQ